ALGHTTANDPWPWAVAAPVVLALLASLLCTRQFALAAAFSVALLPGLWLDSRGTLVLGLLVAALVRLVSWCLLRDAAAVALGALLGAVAGLVVADLQGGRLYAHVASGSHRWPPGWIGLYLVVALAFLGAVVAGLLGPRAAVAQRPGGDQVVPSQKRTR